MTPFVCYNSNTQLMYINSSFINQLVNVHYCRFTFIVDLRKVGVIGVFLFSKTRLFHYCYNLLPLSTMVSLMVADKGCTLVSYMVGTGSKKSGS